jgi:argininosuccinate synthase
MSKNQTPIILAFSGGLDTSFCVPWLRETYGRPVVTLTVNTGGLDDAAIEGLAVRAKALGAHDHVIIDAREEFFDQQRAPRTTVPAVCRRRAQRAGQASRAARGKDRQRDGGAWVYRGR